MSRSRSISAIQSYMGAHLRERERPPGGPPAPPPLFVTLSRQSGAGGTTVAEHLADLLNAEQGGKGVPWTVFDKNLVRAVLEEHGLPDSFYKHIKEDAAPEIETIVKELFGAVSGRGLVAKTSRTILHLATIGNAILVGRAAHVVTRKLRGGLHVRLVGSPKVRLRQVMRFYKLGEEQAREVMRRNDQGRRNYLKKYFQKDLADPVLYDLVINTDHLAHLDAAKLIRRALELRRESLGC